MKARIYLAAILLLLLRRGHGDCLAARVPLSPSSLSGPGRKTAAQAAVEATLPAKITFNEDIGPVLSENCYFCHGQDATARKADLRVDRPEFAFAPRKNGLPPIVKGHPESSAIIKRITSKDPNQVMPPPSSRKTLTPGRSPCHEWVKEARHTRSIGRSSSRGARLRPR